MKNHNAVIMLALALGLSACKSTYLDHDPQDCNKMVDWSDRKACVEKRTTEQKEWERRQR